MSYSSKAEIAALGDKNAEFLAYVAEHDLENPVKLGALFTSRKPPNPELDQGGIVTVPLRDGKTSQIRVHHPKTESKSLKPLIVLIYGGGFMVGNNNQLSPLSRTLANLYSAVAVNISYRLAPMHKFPTAAHDTHDTIRWLSQNAGSLGADPNKGFILVGTSAGANLAAVSAQHWVSSASSPPLTGVSLSVPLLLSEEIVPETYKHLWFSNDQNQDSMILNKRTMADMMAAYEPDVHSPDFSPFNHPAPHRGMPPVHLQVCGADPLRDDGLVYEKILRKYGVKTRLDVYPGVPHGFSRFRGLDLAKKYSYNRILGVGWLLGDEKTDEDIEQLVPGGDTFSA